MEQSTPFFVPQPPPIHPTQHKTREIDSLLESQAPPQIHTETQVDLRHSQNTQRSNRRQGKTNHARAVMTWREHIIQLRRRLLLALSGFAVMLIPGWYLTNTIFRLIQQPFLRIAQHNESLMAITFTSVAQAFNVRIQIACAAAVVLSSPWWIAQIWSYIAPGLTKKERWISVGLCAVSLPLFCTGTVMAWILLPQAIDVLVAFAPAHTSTLLSAQVYITFVLRMVLAFGIAFLIPVVMVGLTCLDIVDAGTWASQWRVAVIIAFIFAAVATPTGDIATLCALAIPICALYGLAVLVCWLIEHAAVFQIRIREIVQSCKQYSYLMFQKLKQSRHKA